MPKTEAMTQRAEHSTVMDRLAIDDLITGYAIAVDDGDWPAYLALFTPDGRADYRSAGGIEGTVEEIAAWLADTLRLFSVRQHLIVNRRIRVGSLDGASGDTATVQARLSQPDATGRHRGGRRRRPHRPQLHLRGPLRVHRPPHPGRLAAERRRRPREVAAGASHRLTGPQRARTPRRSGRGSPWWLRESAISAGAPCS